MTLPAPYTPEETETHSIAKFQSLQAGQYWRATVPTYEQGIEVGVVLLIESIRWVDEAAHTIILRPHPSKICRSQYVMVPKETAPQDEVVGGDDADGAEEGVEEDDSGMDRVWFSFREHRFLLKDFLAKFEFEPDHQSIRLGEVGQLQGRISELQAELINTQSNPALLAQVVEKGLQEQAQERAEEAREAKNDMALDSNGPAAPEMPPSTAVAVPHESTVAVATGTVANAIGSGITTEGIEALKVAAKHEYSVATIKAKWIQSKTTAIAETIKQMTPYYEEHAAAALAATEEVREYVVKLMEGIESLDLYVGKDVEVVTIATGESAPKDVPLTFAQKKLVMDEELAVFTDLDEWFDFSKENLFFEALRKHPELVKQIFPTERCVLVMATTHRFIDYGDKWANMVRNAENKKVFLLIRDGQNIYQVFSSVESHLGTDRLFPTKDDQSQVFRGFDGSQIKFEDVAYTDHKNAHDHFALHYKRFLLLACGLDHRLKLFGEFYDGPPTMAFVSMAFQEKYCNFLHDDDASVLLPGQNRKPLWDWIKEKNDFLRSGSRILCNWKELMNPDTAPSACKPYSDSSRHGRGYECVYKANQDMEVAIAYRSGDTFCVDVEVKGYSYSTHKDREFTCKVTLNSFRNGYWGEIDLAMLCLDMVEPEELHWYIHNRAVRRNHLSYIRFFKMALRLIQTERAAEGPARQRLAQAMAEGGIAQPQERESIINQTVATWRAANRGKPLPELGAGTSKAVWKALLDQMYMLAGEGARRVEEVERYVRALGLVPLRVSLTGKAKLLAYAAPADHERDDRVEPHAWVHQLTIELGENGCTEQDRRWASMHRNTAAETTLYEWPEAQAWCDVQSPFMTMQRKAKVLAMVETCRERLRPYGSTLSQGQFETEFEDWMSIWDDVNEDSRTVVYPMFAVPVGLLYNPRKKSLQYLLVGMDGGHVVLSTRAPSKTDQQRIGMKFVSRFADKARGKARFTADLGRVRLDWEFLTLNMNEVGQVEPVFRDPMPVGHLRSGLDKSPLLKDKLEGCVKYLENRGDTMWLAESAKDQQGALDLDAVLGIALPEDYSPVILKNIILHGECAAGPVLQWYDLSVYAEKQDAVSDKEVEKHIRRAIEELVGKDMFHYSSSYHTFLTRSEALRYLTGIKQARPYSDEDELPAPPEGVDRWYVLKSDKTGNGTAG